MVHVRLGNAAPVAISYDASYDEAGKEESRTEVRTLVQIDGHEVAEMRLDEPDLRSLLATASALWRAISDAPPVWVAADDEAVELLLASHFGCDRGEPTAKTRKAK